MKPLVAIVGLHRTTSSLLAEMLEDCGVFMGYETVGGECLRLAAFCERIMPFPSVQKGLAHETRVEGLRVWVRPHVDLAGDRLAGAKYPTLCALAPELAEAWPELRVVRIVRPIQESIASLVDRQAPPVEPDQARVLQEYLWEQSSRWLEGRDHLVVESQDLLTDPEYTLYRVLEYLDVDVTSEQLHRAYSRVDPDRSSHTPHFRKVWPSGTAGAPIDAGRIELVVKSFRRFNSLRRLIRSATLVHPNLPIAVADDSLEDGEVYPPEVPQLVMDAPQLRWHPLPFDVGISAGRNRLVETSKAEILILVDDDFVFEDASRLDGLIEVLDHDADVDVVAGCVRGDDLTAMQWSGRFRVEPAVDNGCSRLLVDPLDEERDPWQETPSGVRYRGTDLVLNFFAARRDALLRCPWDERFKICQEHINWLLDARRTGLRLVYTPDVVVTHRRDRPAGYAAYRARDYSDLLRTKWQILDGAPQRILPEPLAPKIVPDPPPEPIPPIVHLFVDRVEDRGPGRWPEEDVRRILDPQLRRLYDAGDAAQRREIASLAIVFRQGGHCGDVAGVPRDPELGRRLDELKTSKRD